MKFSTTLFFLTFAFHSFAQKKQNIYYLNNEGKTPSGKDTVAFIRIIEEPDSGETNFSLKEFNLDKTARRFGTVSRFLPTLIFEGPLVEFYKNGRRKQIENYVDNSLSGNTFYYYPNGKLREQREYYLNTILETFTQPLGEEKSIKTLADKNHKNGTEKEQQKIEENIFYKTVQYADSNGVAFLDKDGTGEVKIGSDSTDNIEGSYLTGQKNGLWKEYRKQDSITYLETYNHGILVKGKAINSRGSVQDYEKAEIPPTYKGGMDKFYKFLSLNMTYPPQAVANKVSGKVLLTFVINKDGSLANVKVVRGIGFGCDEEAKRIISLSKWVPGLYRGVPVSSKYNISINFDLGESSIFKPSEEDQIKLREGL